MMLKKITQDTGDSASVAQIADFILFLWCGLHSHRPLCTRTTIYKQSHAGDVIVPIGQK